MISDILAGLPEPRWLEVQSIDTSEEGSGGTETVLVRPEKVIAIEEIQTDNLGRRWRWIELMSGDSIAALWTEDLERALSCPPAPPPSVSAAEETSSGEGRCTAKGAGSCCKDMKFSLEDGYLLYRERGYVVMVVEMGAKRRGFIRIDFCPWCGEKLGGEE